MKSNLSISKAWDETKARIAADGRLFVTVALALIALPSAIGQFAFAGVGMARAPESLGEVVLMIVIWLIGLVGQLALIRLAIGPSVSVGEAIGHGTHRAPAYIGAVLLIILAILILSIPLVVVMAAMGVEFQPDATPPASALLLLLLYIALLLFLSVRMLLTSPVASAEPVGPLTILKRSWALTRGHWLRLFGFVLLFVIAVIIVVAAVSAVTSLIVTLLVGAIEPMTASALILALVEAVASAIATTIFIVMLARIYVQLTGDAALEASVPKSGT